MIRRLHPRLAGFALLVALLLAHGAGLAASGDADKTQARPRRDGPAATPQEEPAKDTAFTPPADAYRSMGAEAALDSLRVRGADGRHPEAYALRRQGEAVWLSVGDLGRLTGGGFQWNPETWRGSFWVDSLDVTFVLDTSVFWVRGEAVQVPCPVRYAENTVWIPLTVLDGIVAPLLGDRCRWNPFSGWFEIGGHKPWVETCELSGGPGAATLTLAPLEEKQLHLRWDPAGRLRLLAEGLSTPPGEVRVAGRAEGILVEQAMGTTQGLELSLRCDPALLGYRVHPGRNGRSLVVEWTERVSEVDKGHYQPLARYLGPHAHGSGVSTGRRILLEVAADPGNDAGAAALRTLADRLRSALEQEFGHRVIPVEDRMAGRLRSPSGLPETAGAPEGDCWVGLRWEAWPDTKAKQFLLVIPGLSPREETIQTSFAQGAGGASLQSAGEVGESTLRSSLMVPWGQVARLTARGSRALARTMADHLNYSWQGRPVVVAPRPARIFRGLAMPAVLVCPAVSGDDEALSLLANPEEAGKLAHDLAFALDEFLVGLGDE